MNASSTSHAQGAPSVTPSVTPFLPQIRLYQDWLKANRGLAFDSYNALWQWSITDIDAFWQSMWDYFDLQSPTPHNQVLTQNVMPGGQWFSGAQVNYAHQVLRHVKPAHAAGFMAVICRNEKGQHREMSWPELSQQVASLALHLKAQGVEPGDRVAAYLPNIPEAMIAFLATVSIGGVWSICAPDMGTLAVLDRFKQIEPKVLIAVDGVSYGGRDHDRMCVVQELVDALPTVQHVIIHDNLGTADLASNAVASAVRAVSFPVREAANAADRPASASAAGTAARAVSASATSRARSASAWAAEVFRLDSSPAARAAAVSACASRPRDSVSSRAATSRA
jgi:acetoacetyl-CoA synthetase